MPKAPPAGSGPLSCLFAINKPTGPPSMTLLNKLQPLFSSSQLFAKQPPHPNDNNGGGKKRKWKAERVKMGQGGTLDPLADGVLVIGTNSATKTLAQFLDCSKEYRAIGLFGCSTDSYDSEGKRVRESSWDGVTRETIEGVLAQFTGPIMQTPPIFSALKMDGKPLYEYARKGLQLPRPVAARPVTVHALSLLSFTPGGEHSYEFPKESLDAEALAELARIEAMVKDGGVNVPEAAAADDALPAPVATKSRPPIFEISMTVSSGTYVRSIIHDIATALGSTAHVVKLTRTRQGEFALNTSPFVPTPSAPTPTPSSSDSEPAAVVAPMAVDDDKPAVDEKPAVEVEAMAVDAEPVVKESPVVAVGEVAAPIAEPAAAVVEPPAATTAAPSKPEDAIPELFSGGCVEWSLLEAAIDDLARVKAGGKSNQVRNADNWLPWEQELLHRCKLI